MTEIFIVKCMAMRMVSNRHVFSGSMRRFKRVPLARKEYLERRTRDEGPAEEPVEPEVSVHGATPDADAATRKRKRKSKKDSSVAEPDNNYIKQEDYE